MCFVAIILYQSSHFVAYFSAGVLEPVGGVYYPPLAGYEELSDVFMHLCNIFSVQIFTIIPFTFDQIVYLIFANVMMLPMVIKRDLQALKIALEKSKTTQNQIKSRLVQIIQKHWSYNE